jgi:hypothetical protein
LVPGRVEIGPPHKAYVTYFGEKEVTTDVEYLVVPVGCVCSWTDPAVAITKEGLIRTTDVNYHYAVGMKTLSNNLTAIAKVLMPSMSEYWPNEANNEQNDNTPEKLLVCEHS